MIASRSEEIYPGYKSLAETDTESIEFYDSFYKGFADYKRRPKADANFLKRLFLKLNMEAPLKILDIGAGTGYYCHIIKEYFGHSLYCADFSVEGFKTAKEYYGLKNLAVMDAYNLGFKSGVFDIILAFGLTPYKKRREEDIIALLKQTTAPLRRGGYYLFLWSTDLSGRVSDKYYNHKRGFIRDTFIHSGIFSDVQDFVFIRPFSYLWGKWLLGRFTSLLIETFVGLSGNRFSVRLLVIGKKR